jgi:DNA-binding Lrp family transcriptional regulator
MREIENLLAKEKSLNDRADAMRIAACKVREQIKELEEREALKKFKNQLIVLGDYAFILTGWDRKSYFSDSIVKDIFCQHNGKIVRFFKNGKSKAYGDELHLAFSSPKDILERARLATEKERLRYENAE